MNDDVVLEETDAIEEELPTDNVAASVPAEENLPEADGTDAKSAEETSADERKASAEDAAPAAEFDSFGRRVLKPYHERYYLLYGCDERVEQMDLQGAEKFLRECGFNGGELRQARKGKDYAETIAKAETDDEQKNFCSYCGMEIAGIEYYRLPDGRMRCTRCSRSLIKTKAAVQEIYDRVTTNMESFFGANISVPIEIELLDERRLKKKIKTPLSEIDNQSILILGAAVNKKKDYTIYLENGAPRISVIATFAHELTHIWQYTHWDNVKGFPKCPPKARLLIYEGMAKWTEIQYLYLVGETDVAEREEALTRRRKDEYGIGFCIYEAQYPLSRETMVCESTPFVSDRYPIA